MRSRWMIALLGLGALVLGLGLGLFGLTYPVTICTSVEGMEASCTTDPVGLLTSVVLIVGGLGSIALGARTLWKLR